MRLIHLKGACVVRWTVEIGEEVFCAWYNVPCACFDVRVGTRRALREEEAVMPYARESRMLLMIFSTASCFIAFLSGERRTLYLFSMNLGHGRHYRSSRNLVCSEAKFLKIRLIKSSTGFRNFHITGRRKSSIHEVADANRLFIFLGGGWGVIDPDGNISI